MAINKIYDDAPDAVDVPANPTAQNAATEALKKPRQAMPVADTGLPGVSVMPQGVQTTMADPNAYQTPPQQNQAAAESAIAATGGVQSTPTQAMTTTPPSGASWYDPATGAARNTAQTDVPAGTPFYQSAQLVPNAQGALTSTAQGDAANAFRGYVSPDGGGFGGAFADKGTAAPLWSGVANKDPASMQQALGSSDPALQQAAANEYAKMLTMNDTQGEAAELIRRLSPEQQALVQKAYTQGNPYAADQAGYDARRGTDAQRGLYEDSWSRTVGDQYQKEQKTNAALAATFIPGVGSARIEGNGNVVNPQTGQVIGTINDDPAKLKAAMGATGDFTMSPNGQALPAVGAMGASSDIGQADAALRNLLVSQGRGGEAATMSGPQEGAVLNPRIQQTPTSVGQLPGMAPAGGGQAGMGNVAQQAVTPQNTLTAQMLSRAPGADRFEQAMKQWEAWQKATNPEYEASTRDALRKAAAGGAVGSGMLQTSLGDLTQQRQLAMDTQKQAFLSRALEGSIEDAFRDVGIAQNQQTFQNTQQQQAFAQALQKLLTEDTLTGNKFQRALQMLGAGSTGNPADMAMTLSQIFGGQSSAAGGSLAALLAGMGQKQSGGGSGGMDATTLYNLIFGQKPGTTTTTPTSTVVYGGQ